MPVQPTAPFRAAAQPDKTDGRRIGVLLCHGFTGSPASMRPWAEDLIAAGYAVEVPRLPGHGTRWQHLNRTRWADWYAEVDAAFDRLRSGCDAVVVAGLSMGGGLSLRLAADRPDDVAGVILVNPAVNTTRKDVHTLPVLKWVVPAFPGIGNDIAKPDAEEFGYNWTPLHAAHSMMQGWRDLRRDLGRVTAPVLLFRSAVDHVVDPSSARIILGTVSSRDVEEVLLPDSFHVATLDHDAARIEADSKDFIARVTAIDPGVAAERPA